MENPSQYIKFIKEYAKGIDESGRGEKTIEAMGLNRSGQGYDDLLELRRDYLNIVGLTYKVSRYVISTDMNQDLIQDIEEAKRLMLEFKSPQKKLSALIVDNYSK
ncbi:hypothetical protein BWI97_25365 [Siphonobacter sp. BAB-5405]|nr:hypothetical protein BWI97_25365 [Siphonobacter sp. BAB-5405]